MNQNSPINQPESFSPVRAEHHSEVIADSGFLLGIDMQIPYGYCQCGCGQKTNLVKWSDKTKGYYSGQPYRYIKGHARKGKTKPRQNGYGRWLIYNPKHHRSMSNGYVLKSILVVEKILGKPIPKSVDIHHVNKDVSDDSPINLVVCENRRYHSLLHQRERALNTCGKPNWRKCQYCQEYDDPKSLIIAKKSVYHRKCKTNHERMKRQSKRLLK